MRVLMLAAQECICSVDSAPIVLGKSFDITSRLLRLCRIWVSFRVCIPALWCKLKLPHRVMEVASTDTNKKQ